MYFLTDYALFLTKTISLVVLILFTVAGILTLVHKRKPEEEELIIKKVNQKYEDFGTLIKKEIYDKKSFKQHARQLKQEKKADKTHASHEKRRIYCLSFRGDIKGSAVENLRQEISALLMVATPKDEIIIQIESGGGAVHAYGLAASQLQRIRDKKILLTACVDKIAASGGYLMACVADKILAAPFAIIGSIGVVAQFPNFNRWLKKNHIDFETLTSGEFKRTLTLFGENTEKGRKKFTEDLEDVHRIFKEYITQHRAQVDMASVATGEHWLATKALDLRLVDQLMTSDDYILQACCNTDVYEVSLKRKQKLANKLSGALQTLLHEFYPKRTLEHV